MADWVYMNNADKNNIQIVSASKYTQQSKVQFTDQTVR